MRKLLVLASIILAGCGRRALDLPAQAPELLSALEAAGDAKQLSVRLAGMGYNSIIVSGGDSPEYAWTPASSDKMIMFWRIYTEPANKRADGSREYGLKTSATRAPRTLALDEPPLLGLLAREGDRLARSGKWKAAENAWEKARRQAPALPLLHARIGDSQSMRKEFRKAIASYNRALAMGGPNPDIFSSIGEMLEKSRFFRDAEDAFEKSAGLDPENPARWARLAGAQFAHGKTAPARKSLARALSINPRDKDALRLKSKLENGR